MKISRMTENRLPLTILGGVLAVAVASLFISFSAHALSLESLLKTFTASQTEKKPSVTGEAAQTPVATPVKTEEVTQPQQAATANTQTETTPAQATVAASTSPTTFAAADTAGAVKSLATAQSQRVASAVTYPTQRIDAAKRDQLYSIAASIILIGGSLYAMTLLRVASYASNPVQRRPLYIK